MNDLTYATSNKAFLVAISKTDEFTAKMMKLTGSQDYSIYKNPLWDPTFGYGHQGAGHDLQVCGRYLYVNNGKGCCNEDTYDIFPSQISGLRFDIKEMEVFQVTRQSQNQA